MKPIAKLSNFLSSFSGTVGAQRIQQCPRLQVAYRKLDTEFRSTLVLCRKEF